MEKQSFTTVSVDRDSFSKLERLSKANNVTKKEFFAAAMTYFEKFGISPMDHENTCQEMRALTKRFEQMFAFMKKQESEFVRPACEAIAIAGNRVSENIGSLVTSKENVNNFIKLSNVIEMKNNTLVSKIANLEKELEKSKTRELEALRDLARYMKAKNDSGLMKNMEKLYEEERRKDRV